MKNTIILLSMLLSSTALYARDYYVAIGGNDKGEGTLEAPFAAFEAAVEAVRPGDTCYIRGGVYRTPLNLDKVKGSKDKRITFRNYGRERVILDGSYPLKLRWRKWKGKIYKAKLDRDVWQLYINRKLVYVARYPNAGFEDGSIWDPKRGMRSTDREFCYKTKTFVCKTKPGVIYDADHEQKGEEPVGKQVSLAETGVDFTGAIAVLNIGHWRTWARRITKHEAGSDHFTYNMRNTQMKKFLQYYIYGLQALDKENEWWYDKDSKTIYLYAPGGVNPSGLNIRGKVRDFNLTSQSSAYITVKGLNFFAGTFILNDSRDMLIEDCHQMYPSTHKFMLGSFDWVSSRPNGKNNNVTTSINNRGRGPHNNIVRNCRIEYVNAPAIILNSPGSTIENCYIHDVEWDVNSSGGNGALAGSANLAIRRNTLHTLGASEGIRPGREATVEYNHVYNTSLLQHDGSAINIGTHSQPGSIVRCNWVHDSHMQGIRLDSTTGSFGTGTYLGRNIMFKIDRGSKFKGDYHIVAHNVCYDGFVSVPKGYGDTEIHNKNTLLRNNLCDLLVEWATHRRIEGIVAQMDKNIKGEGSVERLLRDPANLDFRPKPDASEIIDAGIRTTKADVKGKHLRLPDQKWEGAEPDIGAYEHGAKNYWIPGARLSRASTPIPPDGSTTVKTDADLMWLGGYKAKSFDVYFGENKERVQNADKKSLEYKGSQSSNIFDPGALQSGATYYWRIDSILPAGGMEKGPVWTFTIAFTHSPSA